MRNLLAGMMAEGWRWNKLGQKLSMLDDDGECDILRWTAQEVAVENGESEDLHDSSKMPAESVVTEVDLLRAAMTVGALQVGAWHW